MCTKWGGFVPWGDVRSALKNFKIYTAIVDRAVEQECVNTKIGCLVKVPKKRFRRQCGKLNAVAHADWRVDCPSFCEIFGDVGA